LKSTVKSPLGEKLCLVFVPPFSVLPCVSYACSFPSSCPSRRRWTPDEHRLFLEGIMLYGKDWKKMQPLIKTRSLVQIRTHAQKVFKKIGLKKIAGVMKRRGSGEKDGDDVGDEELEDVLDDDLEHLGMMEGVDEAMLSSLAQVTAPAPPLSLTHSAPLWSQAHHGMVIPHHLMVPPLPPCLLSSHLLPAQQRRRTHDLGPSHCPPGPPLPLSLPLPHLPSHRSTALVRKATIATPRPTFTSTSITKAARLEWGTWAAFPSAPP
jgi:SHAQKYF class myb-like DNA-binding protein